MPPQLKKGPQPPKMPGKPPSVGALTRGLPNGVPKELTSGLGEGPIRIPDPRPPDREPGCGDGRELHGRRKVSPHTPFHCPSTQLMTTSRPKPASPVDEANAQAGPKKPRKLEIRLQNSKPDDVSFSAPFLDNTLGKMLDLQRRMLQTSADIASSDAPESVKKEQYAQSAELSKIIALICAEKARQGA